MSGSEPIVQTLCMYWKNKDRKHIMNFIVETKGVENEIDERG